uniref:Uncharacterized protein n=1 Tax=viral metagenome TaxID=1070528 RepID=A0A6C0ENF3_9ZZZZ
MNSTFGSSISKYFSFNTYVSCDKFLDIIDDGYKEP